MVRIQIQLEPAQHRQVKRRAQRLGVSVAEVIRRCLADQLHQAESDAPEERARRALAVVGKYVDDHAAGRGRVAQDHDAALAEAYRR